MTAIVAGQGLGLLNTSQGLLGASGQIGEAAQGRAGDKVYVNASTGNLVVQQQDEWLVGTGPDAVIKRTYNSTATNTDDNGDNWRLGLSRRIYGLTGTINTNGSTIKRAAEDGAETVFTFDSTLGAYISKDGAGSFDRLTYSSSNLTWSWVDGDTQTAEVYNVVSGTDARLGSITDLDGNKITLTYANSTSYLITQIATTARDAGTQEVVTLTYDTTAGKTNNLLSMSTSYYEGTVLKTIKRTEYTYDTQNRLSTTKIDLTHTDTTDATTYTTTYTYDSTSTRLASITQTDGSKVEFTYVNGQVTEIRQTVNSTTVLSTKFDYSVAGTTKITDAMGLVTELSYQTAAGQNNGQLLSIKNPGVGGTAKLTSFAYDAAGNVTSVTDARGNQTVYRYDNNGNRIYERNAAGEVTERLYSGSNLLMQETTYTVADSDGEGTALPAGARTTRYVYDAKGHLRFEVSPDGRVAQYTYNALGQVTQKEEYGDAVFNVNTLTTWSQDFSTGSTGLTTPLPAQFVVSGGALRVSTVNQTTPTYPNIYGTAQPLGSTFRAEFTTPATVSANMLNIGIDAGSGATYRRHRVMVSNGNFYADVWTSGSTSLPWGSMGTAKANTTYVMEIVTGTDGSTTLYLYEKGLERSKGLSDTRNLGGWGSPMLAMQAYAGPDATNNTILLDNLSVQQPTETALTTWASARNLNLSQRTAYTYNSRGQLDKATEYSLISISTSGTTYVTQQIQYVYDQAGNLLSKTDERGNKTSYYYDGLNRISKTVDGNGKETLTLHWEAVNLSYTQDPSGLMTVSMYDRAGRLVQTQRGSDTTDFGIAYYKYDALNRKVSYTNELGEVTYYLYDEAGRQVGEIAPTGALTQYYYNNNDDLVQTRRWANKVSSSMLAALAANPASATLPANLLSNDMSAWTLGVDGAATNFANGVNLASDWQLSGEPTAWLRQGGTEAISSYLTSGSLNVTAGNRYEVSAYTGAHRATATLEVAFFNSTGTQIGSALVPTGGVSSNASEMAGGTSLSNYKRLWGFVTAPTGAVTAKVRVRKAATNASNTDSYIFVTHTYMGGATAKQTTATATDIRPVVSTTDDRQDFKIYDKVGRLVKTIDGVGAVVEYKYDAAGQLQSTTQYNNRLSASQLAALRATTGEIQPGDANVATTATLLDRVERNYYSADGLLEGTLDASLYYTANTYDAAGRLLKSTRYATAALGANTDPAQRPVVIAAGTPTSTQIVMSADDQTSHNFYDNRGRKIGELDGEGYYTSYNYFGDSQLYKQYTFVNKMEGTFDGITRPTVIASTAAAPTTGSYVRRHVEDEIVTYFYDGNDRVTIIATQPGGKYTTYTYDASGNVTATHKGFDDTRDQIHYKRYDLANRLTGELSAVGSAALDDWIAANPTATDDQIAAKTEEIWNTYGTHYVYDNADRVISKIVPDGSGTAGNKTFYYYDAAGNLVYSINSLGEVTQYAYNTFGEKITEIQVGARLDQATLSGLTGGRDTSIASAINTLIAGNTNNSTKSWLYNTGGYRTKATDELGYQDSYAYNAFGEITGFSDRINATTTVSTSYYRDNRSNIVYAYQNGIFIQSRAYDAFGRVILDGDARFNFTENTYDRAGRLVKVTDGAGAVSTMAYDGRDRILRSTDALGNITTYTYDLLNSASTVTTPEGISTTTYENYAGLTVKVVDGSGHTTEYTYDLDGNVTGTKVTAAGSGAVVSTTSTTYDKAGRAYESTDARGTITRTTYDAADRVLTRAVDPSGLNIVTEYRYDAKGQAVWSKDARGTWTRADYDAKGQVIAIVVDPTRSPNWVSGGDDNPFGMALRTEFTYDAQGHTLTKIEGAGRPDAQTTQYVYDLNGRRIKDIVDPAGLALTTQYTYDADDHVVAKTDAIGNVTRYVYDAAGRQTYTVDAVGNVSCIDYDQLGQATRQTAYATPISLSGLSNALNETDITSRLTLKPTADQVVRHVYDKDGRRTYSVDALGYVTQRTFDAVGNVVRETRYAKSVTGGLATQNVLGNLISFTAPTVTADALDRTTQTVYDSAGRAIWAVDANGYVTANTYDAGGKLTKSTQYANKLQFVTAGQTLLSVNQSPVVGSTTAAGAAYVIADPVNDRTSYTVYDNGGRAIWAIDAAGYATRTVYDKGDNISRTTRYANKVAGTFDGSSPVVISATAPTPTTGSYIRTATSGDVLDQTTLHYYDQAGRKAYTLDPTGVWIEFVLDATGNLLTKVVDSFGPYEVATSYAYDKAGRQISQTQAAGTDIAATTTFKLDGLGQCTEITDPAGHVSKQAYDALGRVIETTDALNNKVTTVYDAFGNAVKVTDARGASTFAFYNGDNQAEFIVDPLNYVTEQKLDAFGNVLTSTRYANAAVGTAAVGTKPQVFADHASATAAGATFYVIKEAAKDQATTKVYNRLNLVEKTTNAENYFSTATYDAFGNTLTETNEVGGVRVYTYDPLGRKITEKSPEQVKKLDATGNIVYSGSTPVMVEVITRNTYDARGNLLQTIEAEGLVEQRITQYKYDKLDRQIEEIGEAMSTYTVAGGTQTGVVPRTITTYDSLGNVIEVKDPNGARTLTYYDALNRKTIRISPNGAMTVWTYGANGLVATETAYATLVQLPATASDAAPAAPTESASLTRIKSYTYDDNNRLTKITVPSVQIGEVNPATGTLELLTTDLMVSRLYDSNGNVVRETDARGNSTYKYYDKAGNLTAQVDAERYVTSYSYNAAGAKLSQTKYADALPGWVWVDANLDIQLAISQVLNASVTRKTDYVVDRLGNMTRQIIRGVESATVSATGALTTQTADAITEYTYNGLGKVTQRKEATGEILNWTFDKEGRETSELGASFVDYTSANVRHIKDTEYNGLDVVSREIERGLNTTSEADDRIERQVYGKNGYLTQKIDANGVVTNYAYDAGGNITRQWFERSDADALTAKANSSYYGKMWIDRGVATTGEGDWAELNSRATVTAASDLTFTAEVKMGDVATGREFKVGIENTPSGAAYQVSGDMPASYRRLDAYFKDNTLRVNYRDAQGVWQDELMSPAVPLAAGKTYIVRIKMLAASTVLEVADSAAPATVLASKTVAFKTGNTPATEWGTVRVHMAANQKAGVVADGKFARDSVDNVKIVNTGSTLFNEDFTSISSQFEYVNNANRPFWQVDSTGRSGHTSVDYTDYVFDNQGRELQKQTYSNYIGNVDAQGQSIVYGKTTAETGYSAFGEVATKGHDGAYEEQATYNTMGWLMTSNSDKGVLKFHYYDANGNLTLKVTPSNNHVDNDPDQANKTSNQIYVYNKRNELTDSYTKRTDDPQFTASGVWVANGGAMTQGGLSYVTGDITTVYGTKQRQNLSGYYQSGGVIYVDPYIDYYPLTLSTPNFKAYESGDVRLTVTYYNETGAQLIQQTLTYRPDEPLQFGTLVSATMPLSTTYSAMYAYAEGGTTKLAHSMKVQVAVNTKYGTVNYGTIDYPKGTNEANLAYTRKLTVPNELHIKSQPLKTARMVMMYREPGGAWQTKPIAQQQINGKNVEGWFKLTNWSGFVTDNRKYEFRYVALDAAGSVLNSQEGELQLNGSTLAGQQNSRSTVGAGRAYLDTAGNINITEQGGVAVRAKVSVRKRTPTGTWQVLGTYSPATVLGTATNGWFQFSTSTLEAGATYDYIVETYSDTGATVRLQKIAGEFVKGSADSVTDPVKYIDLPQLVSIRDQPLDAVRGRIVYRVKGSGSAYTPEALEKVAPGKFAWDAFTLSRTLTVDTTYEVEFQLFDKAGRLLSTNGGEVTLGAVTNPVIQPRTTDPRYFFLRPPISAAYQAGSYLKVYTRKSGMPVAFDLSNAHLDLDTSLGMFKLFVSASGLPDNGFLDADYYYEVYNASNQLVTTVDMDDAQASDVPTASSPAVFRFQPIGRPTPNLIYPGWSDPSMAAHQGLKYNAFGEVTEQTDAFNHVTKLSYNAMGKLTLKTDPETDVVGDNGVKARSTPKTYYYYDLQGRLVAQKDANGFTTRYLLKAEGNGQTTTLKEFHPDSGVKASGYDVFNDLRKETDEVGGETTYEYDKLHQKTRVNHVKRVDMSGYTTAYNNKQGYDLYVYDAAGNRIKHQTSTDGTNVQEDRTYYDAAGRVVKSVSAAGRTTVSRYENGVSVVGLGGQAVLGVRKTNTDAEGKTTIDEMDNFEHLTKHTDKGGHVFYYYYDYAGGLTGQASYNFADPGNQTGQYTGQAISYEYYDDGKIKLIKDLAQGTYTLYSYDIAGNKVFEGYATTDGSNFYQKAVIEYDELNRMKKITDPQYEINYEYDAVGNRRHISAKTATAASYTHLWYKFDAMNRFTISQGQLVGGAIVAGTSGDGVAITYDLAGNRKQADYASDGHSEKYDYTGEGYLVRTQYKGKADALYRDLAVRTSDLTGRVEKYVENGATTTTHTYLYDNDAQVLKDTMVEGAVTTTTDYTLMKDGTVQRVKSVNSNNLTIDTYYEYVWWDSALVSKLKATPGAPNLVEDWKSGTSNYEYDVNGNVKTAQDVVGGRKLRYTNNAAGLILFRDEVITGAADSTRQTYFYVDGNRVGETGNDTNSGKGSIDYAAILSTGTSRPDYKTVRPITQSNFDNSYQAINSSYPGFTSGGYTVRREGEKIEDIARAMWGDSSMWYLIAEANGLSSSTALKAGQVLEIPNKVTNIHNNSDTNLVYNPGEAMGDTSPSLPAKPAERPAPPPPPPPKKKRKKWWSRLFSLAVAEVVSPSLSGAKAVAIAQENELLKKRMAQQSGTDSDASESSYDLKGQREQAQYYDSFSSGLSYAYDSFSSSLSSAYSYASSSFSAAYDYGYNSLSSGYNSLSSSLSSAFDYGYNSLSSSLSSAFDYSYNSFSSSYSGLTSSLSSGFDYSYSNLSSSYNSLSSSLSYGYNSLSSSLSSAFDYGYSSLSSSYNSLGSSLSYGYNSLSSSLSSAFDYGYNSLSSGFNSLTSSLSSSLNYGYNSLNSGYDSIYASYNNLSNSVYSSYNSLSSDLYSGYNSLSNSLTSGYNSLSSSLYSGYNNLSSGLYSGYNSLSNNLSSLYSDLSSNWSSNLSPSLYTPNYSSLTGSAFSSPGLSSSLYGGYGGGLGSLSSESLSRGLEGLMPNMFDNALSAIGLGSSGPTVTWREPGQRNNEGLSFGDVADFAAGFIPGYDLAKAFMNPDATGMDYAVGVLGVLPGLGKGASLGMKGASMALRGEAALAKGIGYNAIDNLVANSAERLAFKPSSGVALEATSGKTTTILGNYRQDMKGIVEELGNVKSTDFGPRTGGFNVLNVPDNLYVSPKQFWGEYNQPWLSNAAARNDTILMATKPQFGSNSMLFRANDATGKMELSGFGQEYLFMRKNGYAFDPVTNQMVR